MAAATVEAPSPVSAKRLGKRKRGGGGSETPSTRVKPALSEDQHEPVVAPVAPEDPTDRHITRDEAEHLLSAFELIDCHGALDLLVMSTDSPKPVCLRAALKTDQSVVFRSLQNLVASVYTFMAAQQPELPPFPYDPVEEVTGRQHKKRTPEETAGMVRLVADRQALADEDAVRREQLEEWRRRAEGLAAGRLRGRQGRGIVPPKGSVKRETTDVEPASSRESKVMLHRALIGNLDVFSSPSSGNLPEDALEAMLTVKDTDVTTLGALPASYAINQPALTLGTVSPTVYRPLRSQAGASKLPGTDARGVKFLYHGTFESFAPTYDSSTSSMAYLESANFRLARDRYLTHFEQSLSLPSAELAALLEPATDRLGDPALAQAVHRLPAPRLARSAALLRRLHLAHLERMRTNPIATERPLPAEMADAQAVQATLVDLVADASTSTGGASLSVVPDAEALRALHPAAKRPGFFGALDSKNAKAVREGLLLGPYTVPK